VESAAPIFKATIFFRILANICQTTRRRENEVGSGGDASDLHSRDARSYPGKCRDTLHILSYPVSTNINLFYADHLNYQQHLYCIL
jgi:hypothetical protein